MSPSAVQRILRDTLQSDEKFVAAGCGVSLGDDPDVAQKIEEALSTGGGGLHALVSMPSFSSKSTAAKNTVGNLRFKIAISEIPAVNREKSSFTTAADLAWHVAYLLNQFPLGSAPAPLVVFEGEINSAVSSDSSTVVYSVPFTAQNQLKD